MNTYQFSFEKLEVWQLSRTLAVDIYKRTQSFSPEEKYSLISQIRRSALSVIANIAEGTTRASAKDRHILQLLLLTVLWNCLTTLVIAND